MNWRTLPPPARRYVTVVIVLGLAPLALLAARPPRLDSTLVAVMALAAALASQKLTLVGRPGTQGSRTDQMSTLSLGFPVVLGGLLRFGVEAGVLVAFSSALGASLFPRRHPLYRAAFTAASLGLSALASGGALRALGPGADLPAPAPGLLPLLLATFIYYLLNTGMVAAAVALSQGQHPLEVWRNHFLWTWPGYAAGAAVVGTTLALAARFGGAAAGLSLVCLFLVHHSYKIYVQKVQQLEEEQQRLEQTYLATVAMWRRSSAQALTDSLTGLGNARHLMTRLEYELSAARHGGRALSLLLMDLDNFKAVNDCHGHLKGDELLQSVAGRLQASLREGSAVFRLGGDEFVVVLPEARPHDAAAVAARLESSLAGYQAPGTEIRVGLSIGSASYPEDGADPRALLSAADARMYQAKARRKRGPAGQLEQTLGEIHEDDEALTEIIF